MNKHSVIAALLLLGGSAFAPVSAESLDQLINQGAPHTAQPLPDPGHIAMVFGKDLKWKGQNGEFVSLLFGDPNKPGIYGELIKWEPGFTSKPHFHVTDRYIYVISGTWWVSSSRHFDIKKMYPVPAGTYVTDIANTVHWDGAKPETGRALLMLVGEGPVNTVHLTDPKPGSTDYVMPPGAKGR